MKLHKNVISTTDYENKNHLLYNCDSGISLKIDRENFPNLGDFLNNAEASVFLHENYFSINNRFDYY